MIVERKQLWREEAKLNIRTNRSVRRRRSEPATVRRRYPRKTAAARAWATINKIYGGGKKSGSGRGQTYQQSTDEKGRKKRRSGIGRATIFQAIRFGERSRRTTRPQMRLLIVSNRLPLTIEKEDDELTIKESVGGLVSG